MPNSDITGWFMIVIIKNFHWILAEARDFVGVPYYFIIREYKILAVIVSIVNKLVIRFLPTSGLKLDFF